MTEQMNFADGSRAERPGAFTFWSVRVGREDSTAAAYCREQNRVLRGLIDAGLEPASGLFPHDRDGLP